MNHSRTLSNPRVESPPSTRAVADNPHVLCVDDNDLIRDGICLGLVSQGWSCQTASGGELAAYRALKVDAIVPKTGNLEQLVKVIGELHQNEPIIQGQP